VSDENVRRSREIERNFQQPCREADQEG